MRDNFKKGKLKIYLGMSAGVGKTYAMLKDAIAEDSKGKDICIGYVESHGRTETEDLCEYLKKIPLKRVVRDRLAIDEFDLEKALEVKPDTILVDELAHSNAPGCPHLKRWQDVKALLDAGINVSTTLNIQHIESISDIVSSIIGVEVHETVPDTVLYEADAIEIIDIPPEELIDRLRNGKIFQLEKVPHALENFFKVENLIALREILLRKGAEKVDNDFIKFRSVTASQEEWVSSSKIVVAIGANRFARKLIRRASRIASIRKSKLVVLQVQNPYGEVLSEIAQSHLDKALSTAMAVGAEIEKRYASDIAGAIVEFAISINASLIVVGKPIKHKLTSVFKRTVADDIIRKSGNIDVILIRSDSEKEYISPSRAPHTKIDLVVLIKSFALLSIVVLMSIILEPYVELITLSMIFMLSTIVLARIAGMYELAIYSLFLVLAFNFFFIDPKYTFDVNNSEYIVSFFAMFIVSFSMSRLIQQVKSQQVIVNEREKKALTLYKMSKELIVANDMLTIFEIISNAIKSILPCHVCMYVYKHKKLELCSIKSQVDFVSNEVDAVVQFCFERNEHVGCFTKTFPGALGRYFPIASGEKKYGVLCVYPDKTLLGSMDTTVFQEIDLINQQLLLCLEKLKLQEDSFNASLSNSIQEKKNIILSSVSHDFKTPLTVIEGASEQIASNNEVSSMIRELAELIHQQSNKLYKIVNNALYYYKLDDPNFKLQAQWESFEEVISNVVRRYDAQLVNRELKIIVPEHMPLLRVDPVLFDQLFSNLIENSIVHSPSSSFLEIKVSFDRVTNMCEIIISDDGFCEQYVSDIHIENSDMIKGRSTGLGLKICSLIMKIHGGSFIFDKNNSKGSCAKMTFPVEEYKEISSVLYEN